MLHIDSRERLDLNTYSNGNDQPNIQLFLPDFRKKIDREWSDLSVKIICRTWQSFEANPTLR